MSHGAIGWLRHMNFGWSPTCPTTKRFFCSASRNSTVSWRPSGRQISSASRSEMLRPVLVSNSDASGARSRHSSSCMGGRFRGEPARSQVIYKYSLVRQREVASRKQVRHEIPPLSQVVGLAGQSPGVRDQPVQGHGSTFSLNGTMPAKYSAPCLHSAVSPRQRGGQAARRQRARDGSDLENAIAAGRRRLPGGPTAHSRKPASARRATSTPTTMP